MCVDRPAGNSSACTIYDQYFLWSFCDLNVEKGMVILMRSRTLISAIIFLALCAVKFCFPESANGIRNSIVPAILRDTDVRGDFIAIGQAITGKTDYVSVWERLTSVKSADSTATASSRPLVDKSPLTRAIALDSFPLSEMIKQNLKGYEAFAGIPSEQPTPIQASATPSPTKAPETPSATEPVSQPTAPIAPETAPVESFSPTSVKSQKIEAFLQEQAAFSDYAIPANVSYEAPTLPFEFSVPSSSAVTSGFGYRDHPIENKVKFHYGTDLGAYDGDPITAFADGTVISAQELSGYGLTVMIDHGNGFQTLYAHCSQILVDHGDSVKRGDKIALAGHSGNVTGPHLHFEILYNGKYLNPEFYL